MRSHLQPPLRYPRLGEVSSSPPSLPNPASLLSPAGQHSNTIRSVKTSGEEVSCLTFLLINIISIRNITSSICQNLAYNLSELKSRDSETYERLVDSILLGPDLISDTELETRLGIDCYHYHKSRKKRESLRESKSNSGWEFEADKMKTNYEGVFLVFLNLISLSFNRQNNSHHVQGENTSQERFQTERDINHTLTMIRLRYQSQCILNTNLKGW